MIVENIITLLLCISTLSIATFMWSSIFQDGDKIEKVMASCIFIPLIIALILVICGAIAEVLGR